MSMKKKILLLAMVLAVITIQKLWAQNDIQMSHFMFNKLSYNPAYAGASNAMDASVVARQQWMGFKNAPSSQFLNFDTHLSKLGGVGLSVVNDKLGYEKCIRVRVIYAYHLKFGDKASLSAGIGAGFYNKSLDNSQLIFDDATDQNAYLSTASKLKPDFDAGLQFTLKSWNIGVSMTHVQKSNKGSKDFFDVPRHIYCFTNYSFKVNEKLSIIPALYLKSSWFITQIEANCNFLIAERFWIGGSYRVNDAAIGMLGVAITKNIKLGYSYDFVVGSAKNLKNIGSHEVMLLVSFAKPGDVFHKSPRFFN